MDLFERGQAIKNNKQIIRSNNKKRLREEQVRVLEKSFIVSEKLEPQRKLQLAEELGIPARQVAVWYQNKRARWRTQSLELHCGTLRLRLDAAAAENRRLQREVDRLHRELGSRASAAAEPAHGGLFDHYIDHIDHQVFEFDHDELFSLIHGVGYDNNNNNDDDHAQSQSDGFDDERLFL